MTPEQRARVRELFDRAAELPPAERGRFLDEACAGDASLRAEVEALLACDRELADDGDRAAFLNSPVLRAPTARESLPERVGGYRVVRELGSGGMGTVYECEQDNPRRAVAIKVIRPGLASPVLVKRFAHEAQILGRLHHPGIAQIYEAGLTEQGQPFFAMELIRGTSLDRHARQHALPVRDVLALFVRVCDAVQHAHDKGVVHRDLKPGNILVDESGQPKVLDFGVARATGADLQTAAGRTEVGQLVGTLNYMSPEQIAADPALIDPRSDVYSLGVILFELLADRLPYDLAALPLPEVARVIRDRDPSSLGSISVRLRGDVETIVAKALEKEPERRYRSAGELGADVRRFLNHEPIRARRPSAAYVLRKFARRHKPLVGGLIGVVTALVVGLIGTTLFATREADQRGRAERLARQESDQRDRSERLARLATNEKHTALQQAYRARLSAAAAALQNHDVADAAHQLAEAPTELRGWEWYHLSGCLDDRSARITALPGAALFLLRTATGVRVGQIVPDGHMRLTDLDGGNPHEVPFNPRGEAVGLVFPVNGVRLVEEGPRLLWDTSAASRFRLRLAVRPQLSPNGSRLVRPAARRSDGGVDITVHDTATGARTAVCTGHKTNVWALAFSPDGARFASTDDDGMVYVWNADTGARVSACLGHTSKVLSAAFDPAGARLVTASADGTVRQWDPATGRSLGPPYDRHSGEALAAEYSPDGEWVVSGGADRTVRVWRAAGRQEVAVLRGHTGAVTEVVFTPDGKRVVSLSQERGLGWPGDNTVGVWDVTPRSGPPVLRDHTSYVSAVGFSPDGRWIASGGWDRTVRLWDAATGEACASLSHPVRLRTLTFAPSGEWLATGGEDDDVVRIWDVGTARLRREFHGPGKSIRTLTASPDGRRVAATAGDPRQGSRFAVYDCGTGASLFASAGAALAYSPDGHRLAARSADGRALLLLDANTHEVEARFTGHEGLIHAAAFSRDGRLLASCGADRAVRVWDVETGECRVLSGHTDEVLTVAFRPDGSRLASAGRDRAVWLWNPVSGDAVVRLPGHTSYVWSLAFSPDGGTLATGSGDCTVRLWDTAPLAARYEARQETAARRPEAEALVKRILEEKKDPAAVAAALRGDHTLSEPLRRAALRLIMSAGVW